MDLNLLTRIQTMYLRVVIIILVFNTKISLQENSQNYLKTIFDYDFNYNTEKTNIRQRFLNKKAQDFKIKLFDKIVSNKTLFVEDIMHLLDNKLKNKMEDSFRNVLMMKGFKYVYKRGFFWRTWREVRNATGYSTVICYKCQSIINETCAKCHSGGFWTIEEEPPKCSYEILSIKTDKELCVVNYTQYFSNFSSCPSMISLRDLRLSCDNPVETKWRITKTYNKNVSERNTAVICQGRENCEITTLYWFKPDHISFRIINSSNNVIYSRIMKNGGKNYICNDDCGIYNTNTKEIIKNERPLTVNLLNLKKKRENSNLYNKKKLPFLKSIKETKKVVLNNTKSKKKPNTTMLQNKYLNKVNKLKDILKEKEKPLYINKRKETIETSCKKLEKQFLSSEEEEYYDFNEALNYLR